MSSIPLYVLKKMLPKGYIDENGHIVLKIVNVITPFRIVKLPDKHFETLEVKIDNEVVNLNQFLVLFQEISAPYTNLTPLHGYSVDLGDKAELIYMGKTFEPGTHVLEITDHTGNPLHIKISKNFDKRQKNKTTQESEF